MSKVGDRVGAILGANNGVCEFLGYGVYEGDFVPKEAVGWMADAMRDAGAKNLRIALDSGKVVYGCECWWGGEDEVRKRLSAYKVVDVDIDDVRKRWLAEAKVEPENGAQQAALRLAADR